MWPSLAVRDRCRPTLLGLGRFLGYRWLSIDLRTLGLFRIAFGLSLMANLAEHAGGGRLEAFYSNDGVLTNHFALFAPVQPRVWSLLFAFSRPAEVAIAFTAISVVYLLYTVGWKTRLMQVLVVVCFISLVNRNLLLQDGGSFVTTILCLWTAFLPLGARFSVDRWLAGARTPAAAGDEPAAVAPRHLSLVCFALCLQLAAIYGLNAANKTGAAWRDGTAVHYILWQNSTNTALAGFLRLHEPSWLSPFLTKATLAFEWTAPVLALTPILQLWSRRVLIAGMWLFHAGIASFLSLGPFAYAMMAYSLLLLGPADWAALGSLAGRVTRVVRRCAAARVWPRAHRSLLAIAARARRLALAAGSIRRPSWAAAPDPLGVRRCLGRLAIGLREVVAVILAVAMAAELTLANPSVPERLRFDRRPQWMAEIVYYLRIYQTWGMFAPDPPFDNGRLVVDAVLADGSHVDPLTGRPPDFEAPLGGPYFIGHDWSEYMFYYPWDRHRAYRPGLGDYIRHLGRASATTPGKELRSFEVYWVSARSPAPGGLRPHDLKREQLISSRSP